MSARVRSVSETEINGKTIVTTTTALSSVNHEKETPIHHRLHCKGNVRSAYNVLGLQEETGDSVGRHLAFLRIPRHTTTTSSVNDEHETFRHGLHSKGNVVLVLHRGHKGGYLSFQNELYISLRNRL